MVEFRDAEIQRCSSEQGISRLSIEYEELCQTQDRVLDFIGVDRQPLTSSLHKQRSRSQSEIIENYAELKAHFENTPWRRHFLD
jgi:hypothetical protein